MAKNLNEILQDFTKKSELSGGIEAISILNISPSKIVASYPEKNKLDKQIESILLATTRSISSFDGATKTLGDTFALQKMEFLTDEKRIVSLRISPNANYVLSIVASIDTGLPPEFMETMFSNKYQKQIIETLTEMGSMGEQKE
ncbi:hypothetical protein [Planktothricoides raciborskii]|uniref:Roadblock/LAMTOR2 domain-containing protein n=1 Tax=Planktothricoides raciborskii FACHB-1370 TaxID=2949576 RepID=A0ABR8ECP4_9CYAN|nr:hypothetical protein [Planktothricoides raciborskii]MBD2543914.1 hypothetical protein [Planktothricoides raciborskii FACHB-1370]MBD2582901.1 hypothetical protein [Planktothricoides raciborskii FACHB-1261]